MISVFFFLQFIILMNGAKVFLLYGLSQIIKKKLYAYAFNVVIKLFIFIQFNFVNNEKSFLSIFRRRAQART